MAQENDEVGKSKSSEPQTIPSSTFPASPSATSTSKNEQMTLASSNGKVYLSLLSLLKFTKKCIQFIEQSLHCVYASHV